ncbi:MAG: hypothetical protein ABIG11_05040 [bacterium]
MSQPLEIKEIPDSSLKPFVEFPYSFYVYDPQWVPQLKKDFLHLLDISHPFWKHAERKLFMAYRGRKPAGTAAAIVNRAHNSFQSEKCGFFGFFETENDPAVSRALLSACEKWLKEKGMEIMRGPMSPSTNEVCGMLLEGFDSLPAMMMPYNPPYYLKLMEDYGLAKAMDLLAYRRYSAEAVPERFEKIISRMNRDGKARIRFADVKRLDRELATLKEIYNDAWEKNWGFVPMTDDEIDDMAAGIRPILRPEHLFFAEIDGVPAGFTLILPDVNMALAGTKGRLTPFNIIPFLLRMRRISRGRLMALGVKKDYRNRGMELLLIKQSIMSSRKLGWEYGELSWILENNEKTNRIIELAGGKVYKKYRIYEKRI